MNTEGRKDHCGGKRDPRRSHGPRVGGPGNGHDREEGLIRVDGRVTKWTGQSKGETGIELVGKGPSGKKRQ